MMLISKWRMSFQALNISGEQLGEIFPPPVQPEGIRFREPERIEPENEQRGRGDRSQAGNPSDPGVLGSTPVNVQGCRAAGPPGPRDRGTRSLIPQV